MCESEEIQVRLEMFSLFCYVLYNKWLINSVKKIKRR